MGWRRFFRRSYWGAERARELDAHIQIETDENIVRGLPPDEAHYAAIRKLGNPALIREEIYHMNSIAWLESLGQDLRYGTRLLRRNPSFALIAILSLALGIGANTAIFQLLDAVRLRTLPIKNPQELAEVHVIEQKWSSGDFNGRYPNLTNPLREQIRAHQQAFSGMFAWGDETFNLSRGGQARWAQGLWVSGDFFRVLGVTPALGRVFNSADDQPGCSSAVAVISYPFWQSEFGGDSSTAGKKVMLNNHPFEIVGVTPAGFFGMESGRAFDVAVPICSERVIRGERSRLDKRDA